MGLYILLAFLSIVLFCLILTWWGGRNIKKQRPPTRLVTSFMDANESKSWNLRK